MNLCCEYQLSWLIVSVSIINGISFTHINLKVRLHDLKIKIPLDPGHVSLDRAVFKVN
jgi:hypothetical protein